MSEEGVVVSPEARDLAIIPEVSITSYILDALRPRLDEWKDRPWVVDTVSGVSFNFGELDGLSLSVASALSRRGFQQNQILYYVTYDMAYLYVIQFAVWRLGGGVRGCFQQEKPEEYARQIRETRSKFVLLDQETAPSLKKAIATLDYDVTMLSIGEVEGATSIHLLLQDDGSAFPAEVKVNPREDVIMIPNTSGSTGRPKGVMHTHYTAVACLASRSYMEGTGKGSMMTPMSNFAVGSFTLTLTASISGITMYFLRTFPKNYFEILMKLKPTSILLFPFIATWFARSPELKELDLSFLLAIAISGSVLDPATAGLLNLHLPRAWILQLYGMSECLAISRSEIGHAITESKGIQLTTVENQGEICVSSGRLLPFVQAKIVDPGSGRTMATGQRGEILVKAPYLMKGYLVEGKPPNRDDFDADGWFHTGDLGFFDEQGNIYVKERLSFLFKYNMHMVSPAEIEMLLQTHPAVQLAGVVGVPHPDSTSEARAYVVLRPGHVTEGEEGERMASELVEWVGARVPHYKHLHGGVRFLPSLPENRGGKVDRAALRNISMQDVTK